MGTAVADILPLALGVLLSGVNPKNFALTLAAGIAIIAAGLTTAQAVIGLLVFVVIASVSVAAPVMLNLVLGQKATATLNSWKAWLTHNNAAVMMLLFLLFGAILLGEGLGGSIGG